MGLNGNRLRLLREQRGISPGRMADILNISRQGYLKYENGKTQHPRKLDEIAAFFNVTPDYLLGYDEEKSGYYQDPQVAEMANRLKDDPDMKILFDASSKLSKDDLQFVIDMVNRMKKD